MGSKFEAIGILWLALEVIIVACRYHVYMAATLVVPAGYSPSLTALSAGIVESGKADLAGKRSLESTWYQDARFRGFWDSRGTTSRGATHNNGTKGTHAANTAQGKAQHQR